MADPQNTAFDGVPLGLKDYLTATTESTRRARSTLLTLVGASILVCAALLNSLQSDWALQRLKHIADSPHGAYVSKMVGSVSTDTDAHDHTVRDKRYSDLYQAAVRAYVENAFIVRVPLFGFSFDVNNLGLIAGFAFVVLLSMLLFSLLREYDNLKMGFHQARRENNSLEYYELIAMEQVLTVPPSWRPKTGKLYVIPRALPFVPCVVYLSVVFHDTLTFDVGNQIDLVRTFILFFLEFVFAVAILLLTRRIHYVTSELNRAWTDEWDQICKQPERLVAHAPLGHGPEPDSFLSVTIALVQKWIPRGRKEQAGPSPR